MSDIEEKDSKNKMGKGGDGGHIFLIAEKIEGSGKIIADGGDGSEGGKGGSVHIYSKKNEFVGNVSAKGGKSVSPEPRARSNNKKRGYLKWIQPIPIVMFALILILFFDWKLNLAPISFPGFQVSPPNNEIFNLNLIYIPRVVFYDKSGNPVENLQGIAGGDLNDFSKILFLLSIKSDRNEKVTVKFIDSHTFVSNGLEKKQIDLSTLKQEFVLFPDRETTVDIMNIRPQYLLETQELNPNMKIDLFIVTKVSLVELDTKQEIYIKCRNQANIISINYKNEDFEHYYPSCLVTDIKDI